VLGAAAGTLEAVRIFGDDYPTRDGTCVRDYIHVRDLAAAHLAALDGLATRDACTAYNLGCGGNGYTVREVIHAVEAVTGRRVPIEIAARRAGDPAVLVASSDRIGAELGWRPQFQQLEGIVTSAWEFMNKSHSVQ